MPSRSFPFTATASSITFTWNDPTDSDFDHLSITYSGTTVNVSKGTGTCTLSSLTASTRYGITAKSVDTTGNESDGNVFTAKTPASGSIRFTIVSSAGDLNNVRNDLTGNYLLIADINLSGYTSWASIGDNNTQFTGTFDGNGHTVSNLTIQSSSENYQGLFGFTGVGSQINSLTLANVDITGRSSIGGLVGSNIGTISDCTVSGTVSGIDNIGVLIGTNSGIVYNCYATGTASGQQSVAGLVGSNIGTVYNCYATGTASGQLIVCGGLIGSNSGTVYNCYATGSVSGISETRVGGLIGQNNYGTVSNCYATGSVSGIRDVGGLVGRNNSGTVSNCYATGTVSGNLDFGGLVGYNSGGTVSNCVYDTNTTGMNDTGKGVLKTTAQMKTQTTFTGAGWDFSGETTNGSNDYWSISSSVNGGYPYLSVLIRSY